jgi:hypothetical protein
VWQVTWYFRTQFDTQIYRNTDAASPLQTEEDGALVNAMRYAKAKHNLTVAFTPFLDPFCNDYKVSPHGTVLSRSGTVSFTAWYPRTARYSARHGAWYPARHSHPHGTVSLTARYPSQHCIPRSMVYRTV